MFNLQELIDYAEQKLEELAEKFDEVGTELDKAADKIANIVQENIQAIGGEQKKLNTFMEARENKLLELKKNQQIQEIEEHLIGIKQGTGNQHNIQDDDLLKAYENFIKNIDNEKLKTELRVLINQVATPKGPKDYDESLQQLKYIFLHIKTVINNAFKEENIPNSLASEITKKAIYDACKFIIKNQYARCFDRPDSSFRDDMIRQVKKAVGLPREKIAKMKQDYQADYIARVNTDINKIAESVWREWKKAVPKANKIQFEIGLKKSVGEQAENVSREWKKAIPNANKSRFEIGLKKDLGKQAQQAELESDGSSLLPAVPWEKKTSKLKNAVKFFNKKVGHQFDKMGSKIENSKHKIKSSFKKNKSANKPSKEASPPVEVTRPRKR